MKQDQIQLRVRYSETDQMGVVYHGNYLPYFEIGRVEWLRKQGVSYKSLEERGIGLPIVSVKIDYKKPAVYDELLTVKTSLSLHRSVKIGFDCEIVNEQGDLLTTANFVLVFVDLASKRPVSPPDDIKSLLDNIVI